MVSSKIQAGILIVGSELLTYGRKDLNGPFLAAELDRLGIGVSSMTVVPDTIDIVGQRLRELVMQHMNIIIVSGGLGPTEDDLTRESAARIFDTSLVFDSERFEILRNRSAVRGVVPGESDARQCFRLEGAGWLENDIGSAPGQQFTAGVSRVYLLPGPPRELQRMFLLSVLPDLESQFEPHPLRRAILKTAGIREAELVSAVSPHLPESSRVLISYLPSFRTVDIVFSSSEEHRDCLDETVATFRTILGHHVYGQDQQTLSQTVGELLLERQETLAVAESCTGGLIGNLVTETAGSSGYFRGGVIAYADEVKRHLLNVGEETLSQWGAVSHEVAREMAQGVREQTASTWGVSTTGIAGPTGGTVEKPVGLVFLGIAGKRGDVRSVSHRFSGDRETIRRCASNMALDLLRRVMITTT